jgi:hypothetical protein
MHPVQLIRRHLQHHAQHDALNTVVSGCQGLYVRQVAPGEIRLFLLGSQPIIEPDGTRVARATLSVMEASYEPAANPLGIGPFMPVPGVLFSPMPVYPPGGAPPALDGAWYAAPASSASPVASADAADTELFIRVPASVSGQPDMTWTGTHRRSAHEVKDFIAEGGHSVMAGRFDVEAQQGFGIGRAQVEPAAAAEVDSEPVEPVGNHAGPGVGGCDLT